MGAAAGHGWAWTWASLLTLQARVTEQLEASRFMSTRNVSLTCLARYSVMYYVQDTSMPNVICLPGVALDVLRTSAPVLRTTHTPNTRVVRCKTTQKPPSLSSPSPPPGSVIQARQAHMFADQGALPDRSRRFSSSLLHPRRLCVATHDGLGQWAVRFAGACLAASTDYLFPFPLHAHLRSRTTTDATPDLEERESAPREEYLSFPIAARRIHDGAGGGRSQKPNQPLVPTGAA